MPHAHLLGFEVVLVVLVGRDDDRHDLVDVQPVAFQSGAFERVVGHQAHVFDPQLADDAGPDAVIAFVDAESQPQVGFGRVEPLVLQLVGFDLVAQADAAPLLVEVDDRAFAFALDHAHGFVELFAAVAAVGAEDVARDARRVHTDQHGLSFRPLALGQGRRAPAVALLAERREAEHPPLGGHVDRHAPLDDRLFAQTVGDQIGDGDDFQVEFLRHFEQLRQAGHRAVLVHDLDQSAAGLQSGQTGQIDGRFGMSRPAQHPLLAGTQRIDMAGRPRSDGRVAGSASARIVAARSWIDTPVVQPCPSRSTVTVKGSPQQRSVVLLHHVQFQLAARLRKRCAEHAAAVGEHEIDDFGGVIFSAATMKSPSFSRSSSSTTITIRPSRKSSIASSTVLKIAFLAIICTRILFILFGFAFEPAGERRHPFRSMDPPLLLVVFDTSGVPVDVEQHRVVGRLVGEVDGDRGEDERREPHAVERLPSCLRAQPFRPRC